MTYDNFFLIMLALNWLVPTIYSTLRRLLDHGHRFLGFRSYFIKTSCLFLFFYVGLILIHIIQADANLLDSTSNRFNIIPLYTIASSIKNYILDHATLKETILYFIEYIILAIPLGFYVRLLLKNFSKLFRFFVFLLIPTAIEIIQYVLNLGTCDIDNIILALLGALIGIISYRKLNLIFVSVTGEDFLYERSFYSFSRRQLF